MAREAVYQRVVLALHQIVLVLHARDFSMMAAPVTCAALLEPHGSPRRQCGTMSDRKRQFVLG
jgi:hypothetical protein